MKLPHAFLLASIIAPLTLTAAQPSSAVDVERGIVVAQTSSPTDKDKKARLERAKAKQNADEKTKAQAAARRKAEEQAKAQAAAKRKAEERAKAQAAARRNAEERAKAQAAARRNAEEQAKAQAAARRNAEERAKAQAAAKQKAEEQAKAQAEATRKAEEKAKAEAAAKQGTEEKAKAQAAAKRKAEEQAKAQAEAKRKAEEKAKAQAEAKRKAEEKAKAEAAAKQGAEQKAKAEAEAKRKAAEKARSKQQPQQQAAPQPAGNARTGDDARQRPRRNGRPGDGRESDRARQGRPRAPTAQQPPQQEEPAKQTVAPAQQQDEDKNALKPGAKAKRPDSGAQKAAAPPPPTKPRSARDFIRRDRNAPQRNLSDLRRERRETREGNRLVIREGDRTIVREGRRSFIRHNESDRFAVGARNVRVSRRNNETVTVVVRPNGVQIINVTDRDGDLIRRVRRDPSGREIVLIDNRFAGRRDRNRFVDVRRPRFRGRHDRYIVDAGRVGFDAILRILNAPPITRLDRRYTLAQVRYSDPLRAYMPRLDLDIHFASGSWQLTPSQIDRLSVIARGLNRTIDRNPRELFLVEGHTDAVGDDIDNLSLSDRRAESVAVALTEGFGVPPENLVTQGYGEEYLKVPTEGPSRENRRVAIRRITPLVAEAR